MRIKYTTILLMLLVALMIVITGSVDHVAGSGQYTGYNASAVHVLSVCQPFDFGAQIPAFDLPVHSTFLALVSSTESPTSGTGYVSRARDCENENRDAIQKLIVENPGLNSVNISKITGMNLGTVRYHLMILSVNHLIVPYRDGEKLVRYFTNNGAYRRDQMKVLALLKREPMGRLLGALAGGDGMANSGISAASGLSYSEVNRYLKELVAKGVVIKESLSERKSIYRLATGFEALILGNPPGY